MNNSHVVRQFLAILLICFAPLALAGNNGAANGQPFQDLQNQIDDLQAQIDSLETGNAHQGPYEVLVDCDAGESINAALAVAPSSASNVRVNVAGTCHESVVAIRANTSIWAASPGAAIVGVNGPAVRNDAHERMGIIGMTLSSNGGSVVFCNSGSMGIFSSILNAVDSGLWMTAGCDAQLRDSSIQGGSVGIGTVENSFLNIFGSTVNGVTGAGMFVLNGAMAVLHAGPNGPTRFTNNQSGVVADGQGLVQIHSAQINDNAGNGLQISLGAYLRVTDGASLDVKDNGGSGITLNSNSNAAFWLDPHVEISGNGGAAIECDDSIQVGGSLTAEPNVTILGFISPNCPSHL